MDGDKHIAIISGVASTGISLHTDERTANQRRRVMITMELPWSAEKALQQLGRVHRAAQVSSPRFILLCTPFVSEHRFISQITQRVESLGALTRGERRSRQFGLSGFGTCNFMNDLGGAAVARLRRFVYRPRGAHEETVLPSTFGHKPDANMRSFISQARQHLRAVDCFRDMNKVFSEFEELKRKQALVLQSGRRWVNDVTNMLGRTIFKRFANRLLGVPVEWQELLFAYFIKLFRDEEANMPRRHGSSVHCIPCERRLTVTRVEVRGCKCRDI